MLGVLWIRIRLNCIGSTGSALPFKNSVCKVMICNVVLFWQVDKPAIYLIHYYLGCVPMEKDKKMATSIPKHVDWFEITI